MNFNRENWKADRAHMKQGLVKREATAPLKLARLCSKFPFKQIAEWKAADYRILSQARKAHSRILMLLL